jgi:hypothetical protein
VKAFRTLRGPLAAAAAAAALGLSGCATADTAAIVNGTVISEQEAQEAVRQIKEAQPQAEIDTPGAVRALVFAPFINEAAAENGKGQSDSAAKAALGNVAEPTRATLDLVKASMVSGQLTPQEQSDIAAEIAAADITLNPRYGTFDKKNLRFGDAQLNWIKSQG